jgi:hypothetical protein
VSTDEPDDDDDDDDADDDGMVMALPFIGNITLFRMGCGAVVHVVLSVLIATCAVLPVI